MAESIKNIVDVIESLESRINSYWNFFVVVVVASIGWLMSSKTPFTTNQGIALTIALGLFFLANLLVLRAATKRVLAFEDELNSATARVEFASPRLKAELGRATLPGRMAGTYLLHGALDISVIYAIWSKLG